MLEKNIDEYDRVLEVIESVYDKEIERVQEEQDAIQAKIDLLQDENDANKQALELDKAKYDLARLQTQRTKKLYVGDRGHIFDTDHDAIREAQNNLTDLTLEQTVSELEKEKDALDGVIEELEKYKDLWAQIPDAKEQSENAILASSILGANYDKVILENRITDIESFKEQYISVQEQIDDNTSMIESYEEKIEYYEGLKQNWSDLKDTYAQTQEDMYLTQVLGASAEADLLNGRLETLESFKQRYLEIAREIQNAELYSAQANESLLANTGSGSGGNGGNGDNPEIPLGNPVAVTETEEEGAPVEVRVFETREAYESYKKKLQDKILQNQLGSSGGGGVSNMVAQYRHDGIEAGYLDSTVPKDKKLETLQKLATEEIPLEKDEVPVIARNTELFVNTPQQMMMYENFAKLQAAMQTVPIDFGELTPYKNIYNNGVNSSPHISTTVGDIHLHGVQNVHDFGEELHKYLPGISVQYNGKHR